MINRLNDAFQRLDTLTQEEARMAEILVIAGRTDENVIDMAVNAAAIDERVEDVRVIVAGVNDQLESAHAEAETQAVHRQVSPMDTGDILYSSLTPECVLSLTRLGAKEAREEIQVVFKHVSDLNRS